MQFVKLYSSLSEKDLALVVRLAHAHGMKTIAHLDRVSWTRAIELGVDALTHALPTSEALLPESARADYVASRAGPDAKFMYHWFELADFDGPEFQELVRLLVARKIPVDLTLRANELIYFFDQSDSVLPLKDRLYEHPSLRKNWLETMSASHTGWTEEDYRKAHAVMPRVLEMARRLFQAGVLLYLGTDGTGGGPDYARELELHTQAGIPAWDVLAMATHLAAERLGIANRAGRIEPGKEADIAFLGSNPINDIKNIRDVKAVIVNGVLHSADSLMHQAENLVAP
jgi:imidazolonepropionase-like amidohydrolase